MQELIKKLEKEYKKPISEFSSVEWDCISHYHTLSEEFIREFQYKVDWDYILKYQKLSKKFIKEFKDNKQIKPKKKWYHFWKKLFNF